MSHPSSWGRYPKAEHELHRLLWRNEDINLQNMAGPVLAHGCGRSYGDACLNHGGHLLLTRGLDRMISFDPRTGVLRCEAGVTLDEIINAFLPRGWFLKVTPGTSFVTLGGAVANDVHGKNHHQAGTFGRCLKRFELQRSDGGRLICSPKENPELFSATIGGLGLTGLILWVEFELMAVSGPELWTETIRFDSLAEFFELSAASQNWPYTVAWLDCVISGQHMGRGHFMRGRHIEDQSPAHKSAGYRRLPAVPLDAPDFLLSRPIMRAFNALYYHRQPQKTKKAKQHLRGFFYPLDMIPAWNRLYGRRGMMQYQCALPHQDRDAMSILLRRITASGQASFLAVLKEFGDAPSPGLMSFPMLGVTLALDFPIKGERTFRLFKELNAIVREAGGRLYPAKDACMSPADFKAFYPRWEEFRQYIDPQFSSSFWRRVSKE
jgi:FAD/FMN-containing dehydrogenase